MQFTILINFNKIIKKKGFTSQCTFSNYDNNRYNYYPIKLYGIFSCSMRKCYPCVIAPNRNMISRSMYSSATKFALRYVPSVKNVRTYAKYTYNVAETNPQGLINNPTVTKKGVSFRHDEFHRERCHDSGCTRKVCTQLCGTLADRKAIGNSTSSNSAPTNSDSILVENVSPTLMNGKPDTQHARVYTIAHNTGKTKELISGTQKMNNEQSFIPTLIKDADDK
jgi:hypothetical protein